MKLLIKFLCICAMGGFSLSKADAQSLLKAYTEEGIANNLNLQQLSADYQKALWALTEAKRNYGPSVDATGQYKRVFREGLTVPSNLQSMLNDINLNNIQDGKIYFPAQQQFTAGLEVNQTLYNAQLKYNKALQQKNTEIGQAKVEDFKIALEAEIRTAYFQYLQSVQVRKARETGLVLAEKNLGAVEKLIQAQKATKDVLYKSRANVSDMQQTVTNAGKDQQQAALYFNFLRNVPLETIIKTDSAYLFVGGTFHLKPMDTTLINPYNLAYLEKTSEAAGLQMKLVNAQKQPAIQLKGFGGFRGQEINLDNSHLPIAQIQASLKWNLFDNGVRKAKYKQAALAKDQTEYQYQLQASQLKMADATAYTDMKAQLSNYKAVQDAYTNANVYYDAVHQKFLLGAASILDLSDAQTGLVQAATLREVWYYDLLKKEEAYKKATGKTIEIQQEKSK